MADQLAMTLVEKGLVTDQVVLTVNYDIENLHRDYRGEVVIDHYGRKVPKHAHGSENLMGFLSSAKEITRAFLTVFDRVVDSKLLIRKVNLSVNHIQPDTGQMLCPQLDLFADTEGINRDMQREKQQQKAIVGIRRKFGKNALLKGTNFMEGATGRQRNGQIGGHKA